MRQLPFFVSKSFTPHRARALSFLEAIGEVHWRALGSGHAVKRRATAVSRLFTVMLALAAMHWPTDASAYYLPLIFSPSAPTAGQPVTMTVRVGECDSVQIFTPQGREIAIVSNVIRVTINGYTAFDQNFCIYPDVSAPLDLVPLAAGSYRVELYRRQTMPTQVDLVVSGDLVVGQAPAAVAVPASGSALALTLLALSAFAVGLARFRR